LEAVKVLEEVNDPLIIIEPVPTLALMACAAPAVV
jgi:hypothetical protein